MKLVPAAMLVLCGVASASPKPCPAHIRVAKDGAFFLDHAGVWFRQSPAKVQMYVAGGCYPEDGPSPTSSVTVEPAPGAPQARVVMLYDLLAKVGWTKDKVVTMPWPYSR